MHGIKFFRLALAHLDTLAGDNAQTRLFQHSRNGSGYIAPHGVRLNHGKGAFYGHFILLSLHHRAGNYAGFAAVTRRRRRIPKNFG